MFKEFLQNTIEKDLKVLRRLSSKISPEQMSFRPKENVRSTEELLQYLSFAGTAMLRYWLENPDNKDFKTFFGELSSNAKNIPINGFPEVFEKESASAKHLFSLIKEEDLLTKDAPHPSGTVFKLGEGIIETSVKWLAAYKMQLFLYIKLSTDHQLTTPDLWRKFED